MAKAKHLRWMNLRHATLFVVILVLAQALTVNGQTADRFADKALMAKAQRLAREYIMIDGHVDLPYRLKVKNFRYTKEYLGIPVESGDGDFDFRRARAGGLDAPFMSIYIPASLQGPNLYGGKELADSLINLVEGVVRTNPTRFALATHPDSVRAQFKRGLISLPMGLENGAPLAYPEDVEHFAQRGIRYVTLTHSKDNHICDSSYDTTRTWGGLSPYGSLILDELIEHKIMIDISHVSDSTFYQVLRRVGVPVIASHSSLRYFTPGFERNMTDSMVTLMGRNGGVIMINFGSTFLDGRVADERKALQDGAGAYLTTRGLTFGDASAKPILDSLEKVMVMPFADIEIVADHIDRVVELAGIDHVGFGSDFDGVGDSLPTGLKDVADYPNLIYVLLERGYSDEDIEKICGGNILRVWGAVSE